MIIHCSLTCISLMITDIEYLSCICGPSICFLLKNAYPGPPPISNQIYNSAINFMNSFSILYTNPLSDIWIANIFSHLVGCLFILLIIFFAVQKLFSLTYMLYPTWLFLLLVSNLKNHCQDWCQGGYYLCFLLRNFRIFWAYVQVSNLFSVKCKIVVQYHCFACYCPVFPTSLIKEIAFFPLYILDSFVMN